MGDSIHLAVDLGADSGRMIAGTVHGNRLHFDEIARFPTRMMHLSGSRHWNVYRMYEEVLSGFDAAAARYPGGFDSVGVDTWGVDYGLLDAGGHLIGLPYAYRDARTNNVLEKFKGFMPLDLVYDLTGIQILRFNTLFQLYASVMDDPGIFSRVRDLLFMPDLFNYFLTGLKRTEFTIASTSQLLNPGDRQWESRLLSALGIDNRIMPAIAEPCSLLGEVSDGLHETSAIAGTPVVSVASHDTASAIAAIPGKGDDWAYISTGTWALVGFEHPSPIISEETRFMNFTNEGGIGGFRILKNMMGFWILQECRRAWGEEDHPYEKLTEMAAKADPFYFFIDPDVQAFMDPRDMPLTIATYCRDTGQPVPGSKAGMVRGVLESLALNTRSKLEEVNRIRSIPVNRIYISGGGVRNRLFCQFVANATGLEVITVLAEGTAAGNVIAQAIATGQIKDLAEGRELIGNSIAPVHYLPADIQLWKDAYGQFGNIIKLKK